MAMTETTETTGLVAAAHALVPEIRAVADTIEQDRRLPPALVRALAEAGLFRMLVPKALGGLETDLFTMLRVIEAVANADGSVGWCVMIGAQLGILGAFLPPEGADDVFAHDPLVINAGAAAATGRAVPVAGGYRVSGRWAFASGCQHATWLHGGCVVMEGDAPRRTEGGSPEVRLVVFPAAEVEILDTWHTTGLRGTGSHDITVTDLFVPATRSFAWPPAQPRYPGPLYRLLIVPLISQAVLPLAIARSALAMFVELAAGKTALGTTGKLHEQAVVQAELGKAEALLGSGGAYLYEQAGGLWHTLVAGDEPSLEQRGRLRLAMTQAVTSAVQVVDQLYSLGGSTAIYTRSPLERHFRDIHTAAAHWTVAPRLYEAGGRIILGLPPGPAFF